MQIGLRATWLALGALVAYALMPGSRLSSPVVYWTTVAAAATGGVVVWRLPWKRMFATRWGLTMLYAWSVLDILLISILIAVTGGASSALFILYALTTLFFALSYPQRGKVPLLLFTYAAFVTASITGGQLVPADLAVRIAVVGVVAYMCTFLAGEMSREMSAHHQASEEAERRASVLGAVAQAARAMTTLDSDKVLEAVVDATEALGFESSALHLLDETAETFRMRHGRALPEGFANATHPADTGMVGLVRRSGGTVTLDDYSSHPEAIPSLRGMGFRGAIGTPVWVQGRLAGVLTAGTREERAIVDLDREALELLAGQASRALENAHRFEEERAAVERLEELDRMKQEFMDMVSHELRTPLTAIQGMGLTLERRWDHLDEPTRRELLDRMNSNGAVLQEIITTLLDFSRLESGARALTVSEVDLGRLAARVCSRLERLFVPGSLHVTAASAGLVRGDAMLLERVIENLVSNAAKHTPPGTTVTVNVCEEGDGLALEVRDEGPGIPPGDLARLGERFFRGGDPSLQPHRGTGLGLALVGKILSLHDSELSIASAPGEGSRFSFRLSPTIVSAPGADARHEQAIQP